MLVASILYYKRSYDFRFYSMTPGKVQYSWRMRTYMMRDEGPLIADYERSSPDHLKQTMQKIELATVVSTGILIWRSYRMRSAMRYLVGLVLALTVQRAFLSAMIRKTGSKQASLADVLTLSRAAAGGVLAGLVASGIRDRLGKAGRLSWSIILLGATATDWLDRKRAGYRGRLLAHFVVRGLRSSLG